MRSLRTLLTNHSYILLTLLCFFGLQYVGNVKQYLLLIMLYAVALFFWSAMSVVEVLFSLLLVNLPIEKGLRDWTITVVSHGAEPWMQGYSFYFGVTVKMIVTAALALILVTQKTSGVTHKRSHSWLLALFLFTSMLSTLRAPDTSLALLGFIRLCQSIMIFFIAKHIFSSPEMRSRFISFITICLVFLGFIGVKQFLLGHPLGLYFEDSLGFAPFGYKTTDGIGLYRVSGLSGHPTFFASLLSMLIPVALGATFMKQKVLSFLSLFPPFSFLLGMIALIGTLSRSGWLATVMAGCIYMYWLGRNRLNKSFRKILIIGSLVIIIILVPLVPFISGRAWTFVRPWELSSGQVRIQLMTHAVGVIMTNPVLGVGLNHFTRTLMSTKLPAPLQYFIYPVHNTWLLFASELGIFAIIFFVLFVVNIFYRSFSTVIKSGPMIGVWLGAMTFIISSQFHTLFNQDPTFDVFMAFLGLLSAI